MSDRFEHRLFGCYGAFDRESLERWHPEWGRVLDRDEFASELIPDYDPADDPAGVANPIVIGHVARHGFRSSQYKVLAFWNGRFFVYVYDRDRHGVSRFICW